MDSDSSESSEPPPMTGGKSLDELWMEFFVHRPPKKATVSLKDEQGWSDTDTCIENAVEVRGKRLMIKNRVTATKSREREKAYEAELELLVAELREENVALKKEKAEYEEERLKELVEIVIPAMGKLGAPLRKTFSMEW